MPTLDFTTFRAEDGSNTKRRIQGIYTGPSSYVAGGDSFVPGDTKLGQLHQVTFDPPSNGTVILIAVYDYTNQTVKWFDMTGAEIAGATNLSTYSARYEAIGL